MFTIKDQTKKENSSVEIHLIIPTEEIAKHRKNALKHIGEHAEVAGFRKGHVPENILIQKVGEQAILEESAELAIEANYGDILIDAKIRPVSHPKIIITKIEKDSPLEFTLNIDVYPEFALPDYKSIAKKIVSKKEKSEVTEKDTEDVINEIKKHHKKTDSQDAVEITDDFVKTLGDFKNVEDFKIKLKENLLKEKENKLSQKRRVEILTAIEEKIKMEVPNTFVENELDQMTNEFSHELSRMGQTFESYKEVAKKTEEEIRNEWREKAKTRVAQELILQKIAEAENIKPDPSLVEHETKHMMEHYADAPKERIVAFVEDMLVKQEVFKFLEKED